MTRLLESDSTNGFLKNNLCPTCGFEMEQTCPFCTEGNDWLKASRENLNIHLPPECMARYEEIKRIKIQQELLENQNEIDWAAFSSNEN